MINKKTNKINNKYWVFKRLLDYLKDYKGKLIIAIIISTMSNIFLLLGPVLIGFCLDATKGGIGLVDFNTIYFYSGILLFLFLSSSILNYILAIIMVTVSQSISYKMRMEAFEKMNNLPIDYFDQNPTGDLISKITYDIETVNNSLANDTIQLFTTVITVIGSFIMMIYLSASLALVFSFTIPLSFLFARHKTKKLHPLYSKRSVNRGKLNSFIEEKISGHKTIKVYNQQDIVNEDFAIRNKISTEANFDADYYSGTVHPTMNMLNNIALSLTATFGSILYLYGSLSIGSISSFVLYSRKFSGPINEAANILSELQSSIAAAERVFKLIDEEAESSIIEEIFQDPDLTGTVKFDNLYFSYLENEVVLKNINLDIKKGTVIAIVGPTGSGKTTIINLLLRFYDPQKGSISFNNKDIQEQSREDIRSLYSIVLQDSWIFYGTIFENISYGKTSSSMEDVINLCKTIGIHDFITKLPKGYETNLIKEGIEISQGQKQLITIARAFLVDAEMVILDEATSNIDTKTEKLIQKAMEKLMENKTCFIVAHRLSTIRNADRILVINNGKIVEEGNHEKLLKGKGYYYDLYTSQAF